MRGRKGGGWKVSILGSCLFYWSCGVRTTGRQAKSGRKRTPTASRLCKVTCVRRIAIQPKWGVGTWGRTDGRTRTADIPNFATNGGINLCLSDRQCNGICPRTIRFGWARGGRAWCDSPAEWKPWSKRAVVSGWTTPPSSWACADNRSVRGTIWVDLIAFSTADGYRSTNAITTGSAPKEYREEFDFGWHRWSKYIVGFGPAWFS